MPIDLNFDGTPAREEREFEPLKDDWYAVRVIEAGEETASTGTPGVKLVMEVQEGPSKGRWIWDRIWFTPASMGFARDKLTALGYPIPSGDFSLNPQSLVGYRVSVRTKQETYQDKIQVRVAAYEPVVSGQTDWRSELPTAYDENPSAGFGDEASAQTEDENEGIPF
jgi:hypothetical protein